MSRRGRPWRPSLLVALALLAACSNDGPGAIPDPDPATLPMLFDARTCESCHPKHYEEWAGSMHAYASTDPVFLAMNRRGQEETDGALGDFCVRCHAPLALAEGLTTDGLNLESLPEAMQGVSCYACHNVERVVGAHNNQLGLSRDFTMRGRIADPRRNAVHTSAYSELFAGDAPESSSMCGACHDVVLEVPPAAAAVHLERTFAEWQSSVFAPEQASTPSAVSTCSGCHMPFRGETGPIAPGGPPRKHHSHLLAGLDVALTPFPTSHAPARVEAAARVQREEIERLLDSTLRVEICVQPGPDDNAELHITLDNAGAGHRFPSGAAQDRRVWVEVVAYRDGEAIYRSGAAETGEPEGPPADPDLWLFRDVAFGADGEEAHMFWDIVDYEAHTIPVQITADPSRAEYYLSHARRRFPLAPLTYLPVMPDRVTVLVRARPMAFGLLDDLIGSGHLDASVREQIPTFDLLPFRSLAGSADPALDALSRVSLEWSEATRSSPLLEHRQDLSERPPLDCVAMPRRPR